MRVLPGFASNGWECQRVPSSQAGDDSASRENCPFLGFFRLGVSDFAWWFVAGDENVWFKIAQIWLVRSWPKKIQHIYQLASLENLNSACTMAKSWCIIWPQIQSKDLELLLLPSYSQWPEYRWVRIRETTFPTKYKLTFPTTSGEDMLPGGYDSPHNIGWIR